MSRHGLARVREALRILGFAAVFAVAAFVTNVLVLGFYILTFGSLDDGAPNVAPAEIERLSEALVLEEGTYRLPDEDIEALAALGAWLMLIDPEGNVAWSEAVPADVPDHYELGDVASFTRWYLNDYPVVTRVRDDGILVLGSPPGSAWKYTYSIDMNSFVLSVGLVLALLISNMVVAIAVARAYARRSWAERDRARREWIAAVSHDVRTPLAVALAEADTLAHDEDLASDQRARAQRVEGKVSEVASLIADLNVANRLSYAMEPVDAQPVALAPLIRSVAAEALNDDADGTHPIELELDAEAEACRVNGDAALLRRMLSNLVGNSVRHNAQGCTVRISLARLPRRLLRRERCLLAVEDDGRGLASDMLQTLRRAPSDELPEHGLGLVIVRRIAAACGGTTRFSEAEGGGTRCEVILPVA